MIIDAENRFSNAQAVTTTANSTNVIDLGLGDKGVTDKPGRLVVTCQESALAAGAATVTFSLTTDDNAAMSSEATAYTSAAIGKAALLIGTKILDIAIPHGMQRYARLTYTVGTGPLTAGKFTADIVWDTPANTSYADARTL